MTAAPSRCATSATVELLRRTVELTPGRCDVETAAAALERVIDPCSLAQGTPLSLASMGLVRELDVEDGRASLTLAVTSPGCGYVGLFASAAADELASLPGIREVVVALDPSVVWSERDLRLDAREALLGSRSRLQAEIANRRTHPASPGTDRKGQP